MKRLHASIKTSLLLMSFCTNIINPNYLQTYNSFFKCQAHGALELLKD
jgi:hypothetical protein